MISSTDGIPMPYGSKDCLRKVLNLQIIVNNTQSLPKKVLGSLGYQMELGMNLYGNPPFRWQERARLDETYDARYDNKADSMGG